MYLCWNCSQQIGWSHKLDNCIWLQSSSPVLILFYLTLLWTTFQCLTVMKKHHGRGQWVIKVTLTSNSLVLISLEQLLVAHSTLFNLLCVSNHSITVQQEIIVFKAFFHTSNFKVQNWLASACHGCHGWEWHPWNPLGALMIWER